ncbi:MAG: PQQ-binding-like beta-propeller repeat protein, partial [Ilumatobacter sp.]|nr:PQQ-binding-like beta-propeller repeat protein [Ilumatobacter sp.]
MIASARGRSRRLIAAAVVLLVGGIVLGVALAADPDGDDSAAVEMYLRRVPRDPSPQWTRPSSGGFFRAIAVGDVLAHRSPGDRTAVVGIARSDGRELWTVELNDSARPGVVDVVSVDGVVVASLFNPDGPEHAGIDPSTGDVLWERVNNDEQTYNAHQGALFRSSGGALERVSGRTGEVLRVVPPPPERSAISSNGVRIGWIAGTVVSVYDAIDLHEVVPPTDIGVAVDEVVDSGDVIMAFVRSDQRLIAFDRDGRQLAALDMEAPDRADDQSSVLWDVVGDRPSVVRVSARGQEVVELADTELRVVAAYDYRNPMFSYVEGRTVFTAESPDDAGVVDVVDLTEQRIVRSVSGPVEAFENGYVIYEADVVTAIDLDGAPLWPTELSDAIAASPAQPIFVDGGVLVWSEDDG